MVHCSDYNSFLADGNKGLQEDELSSYSYKVIIGTSRTMLARGVLKITLHFYMTAGHGALPARVSWAPWPLGNSHKLSYTGFPDIGGIFEKFKGKDQKGMGEGESCAGRLW